MSQLEVLDNRNIFMCMKCGYILFSNTKVCPNDSCKSTTFSDLFTEKEYSILSNTDQKDRVDKYLEFNPVNQCRRKVDPKKCRMCLLKKTCNKGANKP